MVLSEGDGFSTNDDGFGSEPLTSVRLIKQVLEEKQRKAISNDRIVEATTCRRAIERLNEYEERLVDMKQKMSQALQAKDYDYVSCQITYLSNDSFRPKDTVWL